jgi:hypothetical protein
MQNYSLKKPKSKHVWGLASSLIKYEFVTLTTNFNLIQVNGLSRVLQHVTLMHYKEYIGYDWTEGMFGTTITTK